MSDHCTVEVRRGDDWHSRREPCGKPVKGTLEDGSSACGLHLGVERRRAGKDAETKAWRARVAVINATLGINAFGWEVGQSVSVRIEDLERLAAARAAS